MGQRGPPQPVRHGADGRRDAERGRSRRCAARSAPGRRPHHDLHRVAGPDADAAQHVQDRRRADARGLPRRGPLAGGAGPLDLLRPRRRHGGPSDRVRPPRLGLGAGGPRPGPGGPGGDARVPHPVPALLRRLSHLARAQLGRAAGRRRPARPGPGRAGAGAPRSLPDARRAGDARHRPEPGRLLPGARDGQPVLRADAGDRRALPGSARRTQRTPLPAVRVRRPPAGRAGPGRHGLGRRHRPRDGQRSRRRRGACGRRPGAPVPAVLGQPPARGPSVDGAADRGARSHQGAGVVRRATVPRRGRRGARGPRRKRRRACAAGHRRALRALLEGVHARHGRRGARRARLRAAAPPLHRRHRRRRERHQHPLRPLVRRRRARDVVRGVLRPRLGRDRRGQQEHDQDPGRRRTPARAGLLRLRLQEVGLADRVPPALRAAADRRALPRRARELRRLPPLRPARAGRGARPGRARRHAAAGLRAAGGRGVRRALADRAGAPDRRADPPVRGGREPRGARGRDPGPHQHRPADLLLRHLRRAAPRRGHRPDQGRDREDLRPARRRRRGPEPRRGGRRARRPARGRAAASRGREGRRPGAGSGRRAGVRAHGHGGDARRARRRAARVGHARRRDVSHRDHGLREARHLRARAGLGSRPLHPVRPLQLRLPALGHPVTVLRPVRAPGRARGLSFRGARRPRPARRPLHAAALRRGLHRLRAVRRDLPGNRSAPSPAARRSTSPRRPRSSRPSAPTSPSSRRCR